MATINIVMWTRTVLTVPPTASVLTVEDIKAHLAIGHDDDDAYLATLIKVATAYVDGPNGCGIVLAEQRYRISLDCLPRELRIPIGPVREIVSITADGEAINPETYSLDTDRTPAVLTTEGYTGAVKITLSAGYPDEGIPEDLLHAIRMIVGHLHANREAASPIVELREVPFAVQTILDRYRVHVA